MADIDPQLGLHLDRTPRVTATDGGVIKANDGESRTEADDTEKGGDRPADCDCHPAFEDLPYWPCFYDGVETPNPTVTNAE